MLSRSSLLRMFCSKGSNDASVSSSAFNRSRCLLLGFDFVTPSFCGGFKLQQEITYPSLSYVKKEACRNSINKLHTRVRLAMPHLSADFTSCLISNYIHGVDPSTKKLFTNWKIPRTRLSRWKNSGLTNIRCYHHLFFPFRNSFREVSRA